MSNLTFQRYGDLDCLELKKDADTCFILMHGYGASMNDLAPLGEYINTDEPIHWIFPDGPMTVPTGFMMEGKGWFTIDMMKLQTANQTPDGFKKNFTGEVPEGFDDSIEKVKKLIEEVRGNYKKLIIGGFSQGSMMAAYASLALEKAPDKLVLLSSTFIAEDNWTELVKGHENLPVFQSHGTQDPVLPVTEGRRLNTFLKENKLNCEYHEFQGGHEIPPPILDKLKTFLNT